MTISKGVKALIWGVIFILTFLVGFAAGAALFVFCCFVFNINIPNPLESNIGLYALAILAGIISGFIFMKISSLFLRKICPLEK